MPKGGSAYCQEAVEVLGRDIPDIATSAKPVSRDEINDGASDGDYQRHDAGIYATSGWLAYRDLPQEPTGRRSAQSSHPGNLMSKNLV